MGNTVLHPVLKPSVGQVVGRFEEAGGIPPSRSGTLERVKAALEEAGIEFLGDPVTSPRVRLRPPGP